MILYKNIEIYLLVGQKLNELEAVEKENEIRKNAKKKEPNNPTLEERASYTTNGK